MIVHLHVAPATTVAKIDVAVVTTIVVTTGDVTTRSWRTAATSAIYPPPR
jgi:hypothetical protein